MAMRLSRSLAILEIGAAGAASPPPARR